MYRFEILRYDDAEDDPPRFEAYEVSTPADASVLEGLLLIQDEQDPSLAFRYSCRGAVCGSCAMSINGKLNLACRVLLKNLPSNHVVLEPLPRFEIIKDLVVDMDPFWEKYERVRPWLHAEVSAEKESRMSESEREKIDQYVNCVLCGLCYAACPVVSSKADFTGPAALAKLYRFVADTRERRPAESIAQEDAERGAWACHTITRCISACPKNVRPTDGIAGLRRKLVANKFKGLFRRKGSED
ncbi:MAG: succinate dehydrogenase/fumarate reductase iron-sulfur subunit [Planctomycetota bacterium]|jgi:succinate dehydrogenase/fumarate reductase iron-sulfur protein